LEDEKLQYESDTSGPQDELEFWKKRGAQFSQIAANLGWEEVVIYDGSRQPFVVSRPTRPTFSGDHDYLLPATVPFPNGRPVETHGQPFDVVLQRSEGQLEIHTSVGEMLPLAVPRQPGENEELAGAHASDGTSHPRRVDVLQHYGENIVADGQGKSDTPAALSLTGNELDDGRCFRLRTK